MRINNNIIEEIANDYDVSTSKIYCYILDFMNRYSFVCDEDNEKFEDYLRVFIDIRVTDIDRYKAFKNCFLLPNEIIEEERRQMYTLEEAENKALYRVYKDKAVPYMDRKFIKKFNIEVDGYYDYDDDMDEVERVYQGHSRRLVK